MKTTFRSDEIAHAWFHATAPHGKSPGNASFEGDSFYSYGTVIGRKIEHKGKSAVIINSNSFSVSTSKVQGRMRAAIPQGVQKFYVSEGMGARLNFSGKELFEQAVEDAARALKGSQETKHKGKRERLEGEAAFYLDRAKEVAAWFGLKNKVDEKTLSRLNASKAREEKRRAKAEKKAADERRAKAQEDYDAWKRGENVWRSFQDFPVAFRVEGEELVSSLGARVSIQAARVALRFVQSRKGKEWRANGEQCPVDHYKVDAINAQGIVAGCHRITWDEIEHVAELLA